MKKYLMIGLFFTGCTGGSVEDSNDFIPGTYVRTFQTEFAVGSDTLLLKHHDGATYTIVKRSGFSRVKNGRLLPKETRQEQWTGTYRADEGVLEELKGGKLMRFDAREKKLFLGASEYIKIP